MSSGSEKRALREKMKKVRAQITPDAYGARSHMICELLSRSPLLREAKRICCYAPLPQEVDLWELIDRLLLTRDKQIAFPRVDSAADDCRMDFYEVRDRGQLSAGAFGVLEPMDDGSAPVDWPDALVLVPGVAFSKEGARLGYGKGYYDRYFARYPHAVRMGVAFDAQLTGELNGLSEPTDISMDYVQTEYTCYAACDAFDYERLVSDICGTRRFGKAPGIECVKPLLRLLGNPQEELAFVHIAGTNGKGSVAAFLTEICAQAHLKVGCFTSPHLQRFTERIRIGHEEIPPEDVLTLGRIVWKTNHRLIVGEGLCLSMFDYCFAMAMLYFKRQEADLVVLETGLGGRLDATNSIPAPLVSIITGIGLEHTAWLGDTIPLIAAEKAGILKPGTKAVLMDQPAEALDVLRGRCEELYIPVCVSGMLDSEGFYQDEGYELGMHGLYQHKNAAAAIEAAKLLAQEFSQITPEAIHEGIRHATWPGRMEIVGQRPTVLLDGAHNVHGVQALTESLGAWKPEDKFIFFMGVMAEKDYETMIDLVLPLAAHIYTLTPDSDRSLSAEKLCEIIRDKGGKADVCEDEQHLIRLIREQDPEKICVVFGSLYLIGAVRERLIEERVEEIKS